MAYFPATCDYDCKDCSQNKCGWCAFLDHSCETIAAEITNPYYSITMTGVINKEEKK